MPVDAKPNADKLWLGVDWGTHSSKWVCYLGKAGTPFAGKIHSSTLVRIADRLIFPQGENIPESDERIDALKGIIIKDPLGQSFWDADRADTHTSLGEAVSFSFCSLLSDIFREDPGNIDIRLTSDTEVEIGFSFPNWLRDRDKKSNAALAHFHQAARVSCWIFKQTYGKNLPIPGIPFSIQKWKQRVKDARNACGNDEPAISSEQITKDSYNFDSLKWRYLVESCAAGLPYLRSIATSIERDAPPGLRGLGKLLVIDVGAGSTDVGYMLRTVSLKKSENLFYFPPAATFGIAGNELTERLREYYEQQGRQITQVEAEAIKHSDTGWHNFGFANDWRQQIRRHVKEYVKGIPDKHWLPLDVPLQVVVTGGSGVVPGLKDEIRNGALDGLKECGVPSGVIDRTKLIGERLPNWDFAEEAEYARRAVSIGVADTDKPALQYCPKLDPPTRIVTGTIRY